MLSARLNGARGITEVVAGFAPMHASRARATLSVTKGDVVNTILLSTDGSPSAQAATAEAIELASATGWTLRVLTVWQTPVLTSFGFAPSVYDPKLAELEKEHAAEVARSAASLAHEAGVEATYEVRQGFPADEICAVAAELQARLVVLGAHGWGALRRLVFGSVSNAVLHHASSPVLVVRMAEPEAEAAIPESAATVAR
jgi:nucleotide-binding universal stress UspA family protein